jgi:hypothetical protein
MKLLGDRLVGCRLDELHLLNKGIWHNKSITAKVSLCKQQTTEGSN